MARKQYKRKRIVRRKRKSVKRIDSTKKIAISLLIIAATGIATFFGIREVGNIYSEPTTFESSKYIVKGIDISHHNPILNWDIIMEQGITFAYLKATEGTTHKDRNYKYNYELARKSNVRVGTYHFYTFGLSGKEQFRHFKKNARCTTGDLLPAIDVEHSPANRYKKDEKFIAIVIQELKDLESEMYNYYGVHPIIYTNRDCYKLYIKNNFPENIIWMCDLQGEPSNKVNWKIWQFSHRGEIQGIDGLVDLNYYRCSFDEFKELLLP